MGRGFQTGKTTKGHSLTRAGGLCSKGAACLPGLCRRGVLWVTVWGVQPVQAGSGGRGCSRPGVLGLVGWTGSYPAAGRAVHPGRSVMPGLQLAKAGCAVSVRGGRRVLNGGLRGAVAFGRRPGRHSAGRVRRWECVRAPRPGSGSACTSRFPAAIRPRPRRHWLGRTKGRSQGSGRQTWRQCMPCSAAAGRDAEVLQDALLGPLQGQLQAPQPRGPWGQRTQWARGPDRVALREAEQVVSAWRRCSGLAKHL